MNIETGIPIPPMSPGRPKGNGKYPWHDLQVGQSFLVSCPSVETKRMFNTLTKCRASVQKTSKGTLTFVLRAVQGGIRVWRIH